MTTILIVDDRPINRQFLINLLGYSGYSFIEASDGEEALAQAQLTPPDLVITDIAMPVVDGYEFVLNMRENPTLAETPVIFYTATYRVSEAQLLAEKANVVYVLSKPTEPEEILRVVSLALNDSTAPPTNSQTGTAVNPDGEPEAILPESLIELQSFNQQMTTIIELGQELSLQRDRESLLRLCCRATRNVIRARYAVLGVFEPGRQTLRYRFFSGFGEDPGVWPEVMATPGGILEQVLTTRKPARFSDPSGDPSQVGLPANHPPVHSLLVVPLMSPIRVYGWLYLFEKDNEDSFSKHDERILLTLASQTTVIFENLELYNRLEQQTGQLRQEVADRKQAEEELAHSNRDLEQFAYMASHDLQEPLRTMAGFLQLLQRRYGDQLNDEAHGFINRAVDGTKRMRNLISDLLTYSRIGKNVVPFEPVDFNTVLNQIQLDLAATIQENEVVLTCDSLPSVAADFGQMAQLFQNLVGNAIKFKGTDPPRIHISAQQVSAAEAGPRPDNPTVSQGELLTESEMVWRFCVQDNGIGLKPDFAEHIFMPFKRLHSQAKYEGSGVGLAICQKIVEGHKGRIWVESEPGQGSTFLFTIPEIKT